MDTNLNYVNVETENQNTSSLDENSGNLKILDFLHMIHYFVKEEEEKENNLISVNTFICELNNNEQNKTEKLILENLNESQKEKKIILNNLKKTNSEIDLHTFVKEIDEIINLKNIKNENIKKIKPFKKENKKKKF
jgi:hypothetical protein